MVLSNNEKKQHLSAIFILKSDKKVVDMQYTDMELNG